MCKKAGCSPAFLSFRQREGGCDDVETTDREPGETEELSALQSRENGRDGALPALPVQAAVVHAPAPRGNRPARGMGGGRRPPRGRELLRHSLQVDPLLPRGTGPVSVEDGQS